MRSWRGRAAPAGSTMPEDGPLHYEQVTLIPAALRDHKLVMLLPRPAAQLSSSVSQ